MSGCAGCFRSADVALCHRSAKRRAAYRKYLPILGINARAVWRVPAFPAGARGMGKNGCAGRDFLEPDFAGVRPASTRGRWCAATKYRQSSFAAQFNGVALLCSRISEF